MVAHADHIVARHVHQFHGGGALRHADGGIALDEVAGVHQQDIGALGLIGILQRRHLGIAGDGAVNVIGVQNDDLTVHGFLFRLFRMSGDSQREHHGHSQKQGQDLSSHFRIPPSNSFAANSMQFGYVFSIAHSPKTESQKSAKFPHFL